MTFDEWFDALAKMEQKRFWESQVSHVSRSKSSFDANQPRAKMHAQHIACGNKRTVMYQVVFSWMDQCLKMRIAIGSPHSLWKESQ